MLQALDGVEGFVCEGKTVRFLDFTKQETATLELVLQQLKLDPRSAGHHGKSSFMTIQPLRGQQSKEGLNLVNAHQRGCRRVFDGTGPLRFDFVPSMLQEAFPDLLLVIQLHKKNLLWGGTKVIGSCAIPVADLVPCPCTTVNAVNRWYPMVGISADVSEVSSIQHWLHSALARHLISFFCFFF
jgi:hypothetical protein